MPTIEELKSFQKLPLDIKIRLTEDRINEYVRVFGIDNVCISFSGGEYKNGLWIPNKKGLGFHHVLDTLNNLYGKDFIKY